MGMLESKIQQNRKFVKKFRRQFIRRFKKKTIKTYTLMLSFRFIQLPLLLSKFNYYMSFSTFKKSNKYYVFFRKILMLNFRRNRFFPSIQSITNQIYVTFSLGMFSKFFKKGKAFIKNKANFLVSAGFLRKILIYSGIRDLVLMVKRTPLYFTELLSTINSPVIVNYKHPFNSKIVDEMKFKNYFFFHYFIFFNTKAYGFMKGPKKGRIKRKITKRIVKINQFTD
jgi:hypothetical protein